MTTPSTETKSIGLLADAQLSCPSDRRQPGGPARTTVRSGGVFAAQLRQFYRDGTNPAHLSGLSHLDSFIMTRKFSSIYRDFAKTHANPDMDGNCPYHRAIRLHSGYEPALCPLRKVHHDILLSAIYRDLKPLQSLTASR